MFIKQLERAQIAVGTLFLSLFFITIIFQIATRYLGISIIWTEEVANYSFIWAIFMGAAVMVNRKEHFKFDFLLNRLTGKKGIYLSIFNDSVLLLFNVAIFIYGIQAVQNFWTYKWVSLPMMNMWYVWISIPIMAITMVIYLIGHLITHIKELSGKVVSE